MDQRGEAADLVADQVLGRMTADALNTPADIEHGVVGIVPAAVEESIHPPGDAEQGCQSLIHAIPPDPAPWRASNAPERALLRSRSKMGRHA
jgi:hypothetical protein